MSALLEVEGLTVDFRVDERVVHAVRGISFAVQPGQTLALVGESGSGKSVTAASILRLLPNSAEVGGRILFQGQDLASASESEMRGIRGNKISMIFQEPMSSLNPLMTIGDQIVEVKVTVPMPRDEKTKELLRELAKLNPEDPREELWKQV